VLAVVLAAGAAVGGYVMLGRSELLLENRLLEPIQVVVGGGPERTIDPGTTERFDLPRAGAPAVPWRLVRPTTPQGSALGTELTGRIEPGGRRGAVRRAVDAGATDRAYFAPLVTNATDRPLSVTVNAGLAGAAPCGCLIPPGATRVHVGYYPLYKNSTVRVEDQQGLTAMFTDLGTKVDATTGAVGLRFETGDLRL